MNKTRLLYPLILLSLFACGNDTAQQTPGEQGSPAMQASAAEEPEPPKGPSVAPAPEDEPDANLTAIGQLWTGDLDELEDRRAIRVLTVHSNSRYFIDQGEERGLVKEISMRFEDFINKRLGRKTVKVNVVIIPVARNQLIPALLEGRGDLINASLSITPERQELLEFSTPISKPLSEILVTGPSADPLTSIDDLSGKTLFVRLSSSYRESVEQLNQRFLAEGKEPVTIEPVSELLEDDDLIEMVNQGLLPWAIVDDYKLQFWDEVFTKLVPRQDIVFRSGGRIAWAFRKDSPKLAAAVNNFVRKNREGTLIGNVMKNRYIRDFDWAGNALAASDFRRFEELEEIFVKYGEQYAVDYLIAAAQGYQESKLDQSARSGAGAVGIMQLLPTTAKDKNVGIADIHNEDSNIHAGIKYLDFLRTRYFSDGDIDRRNQTLLALAAYNAGPSRMINLRRKAEQQGYDPDIWFDNVELIAAKEIGRETVQYVSNIFKYYVAYRYTIDQQARRKKARERAGISAVQDPDKG